MAVELASDELATALAAFSAGAARPERADRAAADDCSVAVLLELMNCAPSRLTERAVCAEVVALPRCTLVIEQAPGLSTEGAGTTGGVLWGTALAASHWLCSARAAFWARRRTVLELGSGTGVLGLAAAARGCDVTLTDQRALLPLLRRNAEANARVIAAAGGRARAAELDWSRAESAALAAALAPDLVLCSDLVYGNDYLPLLGLLDELASRASKPLDILWGFEERSDRAGLSLRRGGHRFLRRGRHRAAIQAAAVAANTRSREPKQIDSSRACCEEAVCGQVSSYRFALVGSPTEHQHSHGRQTVRQQIRGGIQALGQS